MLLVSLLKRLVLANKGHLGAKPMGVTECDC